MSTSTAVVLDSPELMSELCGANDQNLRVLEQLLQTKILYRGNELYLESGDGQTYDTLVRMVAEIESHVRLGQTPGRDLIEAVYTSITSDAGDRPDFLKASSISIPGRTSDVFPRNLAQAQYVQAFTESDIVFAIGPAGTGKTYLAVAHALREILTKRKRKLVLTRPVVEAGESLGFLPGDLAQKISPYLRPLYDAMESLVSYETIQRLEEQRIIEIAPLAYMRGRSLNDCHVILDEAQNTTREQMKMFLTRIGEGTQAVITGDVTQIDLPRRRQSGLLHALEVLSDIDDIRFRYFNAGDVVRNPLVQKIINAYETSSEAKEA